MKKLLFVLIAVLGFSAPSFAQSFSVAAQFNATYSVTVTPGVTAGVLGRLDLPIAPDFGVSLTLRPFIQYSMDVVNDGPLNVNVFARLRLPFTINIAPSPTSVSLKIQPAAGADVTYTVNDQLSVLGGALLSATITAIPELTPFAWNLGTYVEADYVVIDPLTVYGGLSLDVAPAFGWQLYLGGLYSVLPNLTFNPEFSTDFSLFSLGLTFSYRI